ncbi:MAG TPA: efflux RND transporter periplasmic adaptor subunit [Parvularculaceae bacterium]|nr:efflux RND transporter periplasmic adaptor subunit [Parvularculaceae bacterium]
MNKRILIFLLILLTGAVIGYGAGYFRSGSGAAPAASDGEKKIAYWRAPMDPNYRSDKPGKSPMGMNLIPVYEGEEDVAAGSTVRINPSEVNNIGVRTAKVEWASLHPQINTVGRITYDEKKVANFHLRSSGWIQHLTVRSEGEAVSKNDLLFEVYSPDLVNAQAEFLQTLRTGDKTLIEAAKDRLRALYISEDQIKELERSRRPAQYVKFFAPISGVLTQLNVADGQYFKPDTMIMAIADLSTVWLISDVFESDSDQLRVGAQVAARSKFEPGGVLAGTIDYVYPDLDPTTRTIPARTVLDNGDGKLKPGMFMTVAIDGPERPAAAIIPRQALIRTGRQERVILALGEGRFQPAAVTSGIEADGKVEILSGLQPDEIIVISGQFLIDSESSFAGATLRMSPPGATSSDDATAPAPEKEHEGHSAPPNGAVETPHGKKGAHGNAAGSQSEAVPVKANGVVKKINPAAKTITIAHEAIPEIGWPAMTMDFAVSAVVDLSAIGGGEHVLFALARGDDDRFVVQSVERAR